MGVGGREQRERGGRGREVGAEGERGRRRSWNSGQGVSGIMPMLTFVCLPIMYSKRTFLKYCKRKGGRRKGGREGGRERGREGGREGGREKYIDRYMM